MHSFGFFAEGLDNGNSPYSNGCYMFMEINHSETLCRSRYRPLFISNLLPVINKYIKRFCLPFISLSL